jgi:hypothetical protein
MFSAYSEVQLVRAGVKHDPKLRVELGAIQAQINELRAMLDQTEDKTAGVAAGQASQMTS